MDVFKVHERVIADYRAFTSGFVEVRDARIQQYVDDQFEQGVQWPHPWLSLNPSFASGGAVPDLVAEGLLHPEAARIFRRKDHLQDAGRDPIVLHQHQREAIETARSGKSYVLTTGTGSGKSLAYIMPIVDEVLRDRDARGGERRPGVKAIVVYPVNALANSQVNELSKFLSFGYPQGGEPVTFARYTGQESQDERIRILAEPPDILLTNYVMLELVLTRPDERKRLVRAAQGLRFLALDELHTYRGRQGADVAMLIRRLRDQCASDDLQIVGTSATMASGGTQSERNEVVARVATRLFGAEVTPDRVIGETLVRATPDLNATDQELATAISNNANQHARSFADFAADPLASWVETTFGLMLEPGTDRLVRRTPTTVLEAADQLASRTGQPVESCAVALRNVLREGSSVGQPDTGRPVFAFRLHQFLSKGDTVYVSLEPEDTRHITGTYQVSVPDHPEKALLPLGFCRECGQEYLVVAKVGRDDTSAFVSRRDVDASGGDSVTGYLYVSSDLPWPEDPLAAGRLPESWLVTDPDTDRVEILDSKRKYLPTKVFVSPTSTIDESRTGLPAWFVSTPFAFCMRCGVSYEQVRGNDFGKLATLDAEGRSSAMTLLSASIVRSLRAVPESELPASARKLLTFVDNRQDASLQAGHFNDFVQVAQLRAALYAALQAAGTRGLTHEALADAVTDALGLQMRDFAQSPDAKFGARKDAERALRSVVEYQLYVDLQRGWRVTMPNLEQTGLVKVAYRDLPELAADEESWAGTYLLDQISGEQREELARILLDELRRVRAIEVDCLTEEGFDRLRRLARSHLIEPWTLGEDERVVEAGVAIPRPARAGGRRALLAVSGRGAFGKYLRRDAAGLPGEVRTEDSDRVIQDMFLVLTDAGLLSRTDGADGPEYRINAGALRWIPGDGTTGASDPLRKAFSGEETARVNPFFRELYRDLARGYGGMLAREHTAQVPQRDRLEREADFRTGNLPLLYCSPTMELGVDISDLNAVGLRNVPPTPDSRPLAVEVPADLDTMTHINEFDVPARWEVLADRQAICRSDTDAVMGVFTRGYEMHQYDEWLLTTVASILDDDLCISSAGLLRGGAIAWVEVSVPESITTPEGVVFRPNLLATTSFDGSIATTYKKTITDVVCDNTREAALREDGQTYKVKHSRHSHAQLAPAREALAMVHILADDFAREVAQLCATTVTDRDWARFLDIHVSRINITGHPLKGRALTLADKKRDTLQRLYHHDQRVSPWSGTAHGVIQAINTYEHHESTVRGAQRPERNMLRTITGDFGKLDRHTLSTLTRVLA